MDTCASLLTSDAPRISSSWKLSSVVRLSLAAGAAIALVVTGVHFIRSSKSDKPSLQGTQLQAFSVSELSTVYRDAALNVRFEGFMQEHRKTYATSEERALRFEIFKSNARFIEEENSKGLDYTLGENAFMDLTWDEFKQQYLGVDMDWFQQYTNNGDIDTELIVQKNSLPKTFDEWREKGCVTDVKDQGPCGSCWAFSATGSMEGIYCAAGLGKVNLSEQQLVDCARKEGNQGCRGGLMSQAFDYVLHNNGLCSESDYPYTARDGICKSSECKNAMTISSWFTVPKGNEAALMAGIVKRGPIAVAIEANPSFQFYRSGVFTERCGMSLNHGVLAVGYGEEHGKEYFIVKNSWGNRWGEQGYIRMGRGNRFSNHGQCGIQVWPVFPRVN